MPTDWYTPRSLFNFGRRASRREYAAVKALAVAVVLSPALLGALLARVFGVGDGQSSSTPTALFLVMGPLQAAAWIAGLVAVLAVSVRRMHDHDKSGWGLLLILIPLAGWIFLFLFIFTPGDEGENQYGPDPRHEPRPGAERLASLEQVFE